MLAKRWKGTNWPQPAAKSEGSSTPPFTTAPCFTFLWTLPHQSIHYLDITLAIMAKLASLVSKAHPFCYTRKSPSSCYLSILFGKKEGYPELQQSTRRVQPKIDRKQNCEDGRSEQ